MSPVLGPLLVMLSFPAMKKPSTWMAKRPTFFRFKSLSSGSGPEPEVRELCPLSAAGKALSPEEGLNADRALGSSGQGWGRAVSFLFCFTSAHFEAWGSPRLRRRVGGQAAPLPGRAGAPPDRRPRWPGARPPLRTPTAPRGGPLVGISLPPQTVLSGRRLSDGPPQANEDTSPSCALPNGEAAAARRASSGDSAGGRPGSAGLPPRRTRAELRSVCGAEALRSPSWRREC